MAAFGLAWNIQPVPARLYREARALKERRAVSRIPSIVDPLPMSLELAEEAD
jgi:hypothetical protein